MKTIERIPDDVIVLTDADTFAEHYNAVIPENVAEKQEKHDAKVRFEQGKSGLSVFLTAKTAHPTYVVLRWNERADGKTYVLGDAWERAYGLLGWSPLSGERFLPWYFLSADESGETVGCGVKVRPASFVSFCRDASGISAWFDVRNGGVGVELNGRELCVGTVVCRRYSGMSAFRAGQAFCKVLCDDPILPKEAVYGGNNWYYAYGKSSREEILEDAKLISRLSAGNAVRPYMVIDDGWQPNPCAGPWVPNEKFGDMKTLASEMENAGAKPGIWVRLLHDDTALEAHPEWRLQPHGEVKNNLDPSHPGVLEYVRETVCRFRGWGYKLLKHDYTTFDLFGVYGHELNGTVNPIGNWAFFDRTKTTAEIVSELYRVIREAAGDMVIIGCNTVSHLCAGLCEVNRVGDDTSGKYWTRTRVLGVNSLAFRLMQNRAFYMVDADCVGILGHNLPWHLNSRWMRLLAASGTPLFLSCEQGVLTEEQEKEVADCLARSSVQNDDAEPLDWEYNTTPQTWSINGKTETFDWSEGVYPALLKRRHQPI